MIGGGDGSIVAEEEIDGEESTGECPNGIGRRGFGESFEGGGEEVEGEEGYEGWSSGVVVDEARSDEGEEG